jgi:hypothetical protein
MEDNIKFCLEEIGRGVVYWIDLAHDMDEGCSVVNLVMKHTDKWNAGKWAEELKNYYIQNLYRPKHKYFRQQSVYG